MAKVKEVRIDVGITLNLGNFESAKVLAGVTLELAENEDYKEVFKNGWEITKGEIIEQVVEVKQGIKSLKE